MSSWIIQRDLSPDCFYAGLQARRRHCDSLAEFNRSCEALVRNCEGNKISMPTQTQVRHSSNEPLFDIFGPLIQFLVTPAQSSEAFALMRGMVPPGVAIPLHSHADPEVLFVLEGELNVLQLRRRL